METGDVFHEFNHWNTTEKFLETLCVEDNYAAFIAAVSIDGRLKPEIASASHSVLDGEPLLGRLLALACRVDARRVGEYLIEAVDKSLLSFRYESEDIATRQTFTLLHIASFYGSVELLTLLISLGAPIEATTAGKKMSCEGSKRTPLHLASQEGHDDCVKILCDAKANVEAVDNLNNTPLHLACEGGHDECVKTLCDFKADVGVKDRVGRTPLYLVCGGGHYKCAKLLVDAKAYVNTVIRNRVGGTPLHQACGRGHSACAQILCDAKADINARDDLNRPPLHLACQGGHDGCVKILCDFKADVGRKTSEGRTPLHRVCERGYSACAKILCDAKADINARDDLNNTPLHLACQGGHDECVKTLCDVKADVGVKDIAEATPLHLACQEGHDKCAQILLDAKADVNALNKYRRTPLHLACMKCHSTCVKILCEAKANVLAVDSNGDIAVVLAMEHVSVRESLLPMSSSPEGKKVLLAAVQAATKARGTPLVELLSFVVQNAGDGGDDDDVVAAFQVCLKAVQDGDTMIFEKFVLDQQAFACQMWLRAMIKNHMLTYDDRPLLVVRFLGHPGAGKTSIVKSLTEKRSIRSKASHFLRGDRRDTKANARTKGIRRRYISGVIYLDLGGQYRFMPAHQKLLKFSDLPALNVLTISTAEERHIVRCLLRQWSDFIACSQEKGGKRNKVVIAATRDDTATQAQRETIQEECEFLESAMESHLEFLDKPVIFVNAMKEASNTIAEIRDMIDEQKKLMKEEAEACSCAVESYIEEIRMLSSSAHTVTKTEFIEYLLQAVLGERFHTAIKGDRHEHVVTSMMEVIDVNKELHELHQQAQLFYFPEAALIVLEPTWLMSDITGKLFSPAYFPPPHIGCDENGFAKRTHVIRVLGQDSPLPGEDALDIASKLGMCLPTQRGDQVLIVPAQEDRRKSRHWSSPNADTHKSYAGRRLYCKTGIAMSASVVPSIQLALAKEFGSGSFHLWRGGITISTGDYPGTESLVEAASGELALNVITRGPQLEQVAALQERVWRHTEKSLANLSPGSGMETVFIADDLLCSDRLKMMDASSDLDAGMSFMASDRLRDEIIFPPVSSDIAAHERRPDYRLKQMYTHRASPSNAKTADGRRKASRYCSALYQHQLLLHRDRKFPLEECAEELVVKGEVNGHFRDDIAKLIREHQLTTAADTFRDAICNLPDSVVTTLVDDILPRLAGTSDVHHALQHCPGHVFCPLKSSETHSAPGSVHDAVFNPWKHPLFHTDKYHKWILCLPAATLREKARSQGLLLDHQLDLTLQAREWDGPVAHNSLLLNHLMPGGRDSFVKFIDAVAAMYPHKRAQFEQLLTPPVPAVPDIASEQSASSQAE